MPPLRTLPLPAATGPFLVLPENRFAYTAIASLGDRASPDGLASIFLYGPSGVGKSHLAQHGGLLVARRKSGTRCRHVIASEFAAELAEASVEKTIPELRDAGRRCDLLILEDLHALEGRAETQQLLLTLADDLAAAGCQIIWTCRKSPGELANFLPRLVNRFHAGVTALVRLPACDSRISLLGHFAETRQVPLPAECLPLLADALPYSPRELLSAIMRLEAESRQQKCRIDAAFVRKFLRHEVKPPAIALADIARAVARHFGISVAQLRSRTRVQGLVLPRQCAMFLSRDLTGKGLGPIGTFYGDRDHSTVVHACHRLKALLEEEPTVRTHVAQIHGALGVM